MTANGYYTFKVHKTATKQQIVHALEVMFGIAVVEIKTIRTGQTKAHWSHKKKKNIKVEVGKKALVKFNPDVELNMEKIQSMMDNRQQMMRG
jgi:ribosomal protein L23